MHLIQSAVWAFTNAHPVSSIYSHSAPVASESFARYTAGILKKKAPSYYIEYALNNAEGRPVIIKGREKTYVNMSWSDNDGYRNIHLSVYTPDGRKYRQVTDNIISDKNGSTAVVELNTTHDGKGTFIVRLHDDANKILQEKIVILGADDDE
jgi:hypothetical protein